MKSKMTLRTICLLTFASVVFAACSRGNESPPPPPLPASWTQPATRQPGTKVEAPSAEATELVESSLKVHTGALERGLRVGEPKTVVPPAAPVGWHLDGMIAAFAVNVNGVFGALISDSAPGLKVTWQRQAEKPQSIQAPMKTTIHFSPKMSETRLAKLIEPAVLVAKKTHAISDVARFKKNALAEAGKFLAITRVLSTIGRSSGWHVAGYQLQLTFTASGELTPTLGVGGGMTLYFDWETNGPEVILPEFRLSTQEHEIKKTLLPFVGSMSSMIAAAKSESRELRQSGFEFQVFQIGIGFGLGGDIGVASAQGSIIGRIIFKKDERSTSQAITLAQHNRAPTLPVQVFSNSGNAPLLKTSNFAQDQNLFTTQVQPQIFVENIHRAIEMGTYFVERAKTADTPNFKCVEVEAGFDVDVSGDIGLATVTGFGLIRLGFERVGL